MILSPFLFIFTTWVSVLISPLLERIYFSNTLKTSSAFWDSGKALFLASITKGSFLLSKNAKVSFAENFEKGENRNSFDSGKFFKNSRISNSALVILHLPPPVIFNFLPRFLFFSKTKTLAPSSPALPAIIIPLGPPPITIRSYSFCFSVFFIPLEIGRGLYINHTLCLFKLC